MRPPPGDCNYIRYTPHPGQPRKGPIRRSCARARRVRLAAAGLQGVKSAGAAGILQRVAFHGEGVHNASALPRETVVRPEVEAWRTDSRAYRDTACPPRDSPFAFAHSTNAFSVEISRMSSTSLARVSSSSSVHTR